MPPSSTPESQGWDKPRAASNVAEPPAGHAPPASQYPSPPPPSSYAGTPGYGSPVPANNGLAVAAFVLALLGVSGIAVVCGYISRSQIDRSAGAQGNRWMATTGIVLGWIGVAAWTVIIIAALASAPEYSYTTTY